MKTTLNLDDVLVAEAKAQAARQRISLTRLIEEGLRLRLKSRVFEAASDRPVLPVLKGHGGLLPGIDPLSNRSMLDALDT